MLDPAANRLPAAVRRIHLMGICGTAMGALAAMLVDAGYEVRGSDGDVYPPMSEFLARRGIPVARGYDGANLAWGPDLVVVGNVISADNPEAVALAERGIPYLSLPQLLAQRFIGDKTSLVVAGTHGKTTTSSMLATALHHAGRDPSCMIGGVVQAFGANYRLGRGDCFVVEGDEYDTAFFDKNPKFLHYRPWVAVLTSVEFDHADIYPDFASVQAAFRRLVAILPPDGLLVAGVDDPVVAAIAGQAPCPVAGYGFSGKGRWRAVDCDPGRGVFTALLDGRVFCHCRLPVPGRHNIANALAVVAVLHHLGLEPAAISGGLAAFAGVRRRQEVRGEAAGVTVIDDFAHHPTAVRETLDALAAAYPGRRLIAVFEPRSNSSRRNLFQEDYARAFAGRAQLVLVREPLPHRNIPVAAMFSSARLAADLQARGQPAASFPDATAIIDFLVGAAQAGDVVAVLSNGGFEDIHQRLLAALAAREGEQPGE